MKENEKTFAERLRTQLKWVGTTCVTAIITAIVTFGVTLVIAKIQGEENADLNTNINDQLVVEMQVLNENLTVLRDEVKNIDLSGLTGDEIIPVTIPKSLPEFPVEAVQDTSSQNAQVPDSIKLEETEPGEFIAFTYTKPERYRKAYFGLGNPLYKTNIRFQLPADSPLKITDVDSIRYYYNRESYTTLPPGERLYLNKMNRSFEMRIQTYLSPGLSDSLNVENGIIEKMLPITI
mgnify:CR=1 FL=1